VITYPMFYNVPSCKFESVTFAEFERKCMALYNVTLRKCIREEGFVSINEWIF
jgi:hypothetical protein